MKQLIINGILAIYIAAPMLSHGASANDILTDAGVQGGFIVHIGCGDGSLTAALRANDSFLVHGLDTSADNIKKARAHLHKQGIYGKVSVERLIGSRLPYTDNLVNLLVSDNLGAIPMTEVMRVLSPNGVAYIKGKKTVKPRPSEIDEWTHFLYNAGNNAVGKDTVVGPPKRYQWVSGPKWARSHDHLSTVSAMVSSNGRIFYIIDEGTVASVAIAPRWFLVARDAFSGVFLWKRPVGPWEGHLRDFRSGPTELSRRLVSIGDRVYVTLGYGKPVTALDAATGKTVRTYKQTGNALEIISHDGLLFVVVGDRVPDNTDGAAEPREPTPLWMHWKIWRERPPKKHVVAVKADSGDIVWSKSDEETVDLMPTTLCAAGKQVFFQNHKQILAMESSSGEVVWRAERPVNIRRPSWSAPTLVIHKDVILCGDRAVDVVTQGANKEDKKAQWIVNSQGGIAPQGQITAFSIKTGEKLWEAPCKEVYNAPVDVLVADDLVWSGVLVQNREPGITKGLDYMTGEVKRERPRDQEFFKIRMFHHRCYRNRATEKYLVLGRDGIEYIDITTGEGFGHAWVRGSCQYGVMPCNGLTYAPSHSCACHIESKLDSFNALAGAPAAGQQAEESIPVAARLQKGSAFGKLDSTTANPQPGAWPTYRHNGSRSGSTEVEVPAELKIAWQTKLGGRLSAIVAADNKLLVADIDSHRIHALDTKSGKPSWSYTAGGRVDSPPTIHAGGAIFGSADGWITCLRLKDGELAWRFRAAPQDRRIVAYGQVESAWPLHGSVLVEDGIVYAVAGRSAFLDGGMLLLRLDAVTGKMLSEKSITTAALPDVMSSDGNSVFLRHRRFDKEGVEQQPNVPHLYCSAGFLDGSWWHRTYWQVSSRMGSNYGGWPTTGSRVPAGRIMVMDDSAIYGFGRFNQYSHIGGHVGLGNMRYLLYAHSLAASADSRTDGRKKKGARKGGSNRVTSIWSKKIPILARGMVLSAGKMLFVAGPPDVFGVAPGEKPHPYDPTSPEALLEQNAALEGQRGGLLWVVSVEEGEKLAEYELESPPVWDGMAAAEGRLYSALMDGSVICWQ